MKIYSIGRDINCNIVIDDNTDVISRRHATLNVAPSGKMTIVDQSHNGTYVNGIRIASNVPVPVTRKDNVSFAHVARLDWNLVPKPFSPLLWVAAILGAIALLVGLYFGIKALVNSGGAESNKSETSVEQPAATIVLTPDQVARQQDSIKLALTKDITDSLRKKAVEDSLAREKVKAVAKAKADSIAKIKADSIEKARKQRPAQKTAPTPRPKTNPTPKKEEAPKPKQF